MENVKIGMVFRNLEGKKCHVSNIYLEGNEEVVTYRYWVRNRWIFKTDFKELFLIPFDYGYEWEKPKDKEDEEDESFRRAQIIIKP